MQNIIYLFFKYGLTYKSKKKIIKNAYDFSLLSNVVIPITIK